MPRGSLGPSAHKNSYHQDKLAVPGSRNAGPFLSLSVIRTCLIWEGYTWCCSVIIHDYGDWTWFGHLQGKWTICYTISLAHGSWGWGEAFASCISKGGRNQHFHFQEKWVKGAERSAKVASQVNAVKPTERGSLDDTAYRSSASQSICFPAAHPWRNLQVPFPFLCFNLHHDPKLRFLCLPYTSSSIYS